MQPLLYRPARRSPWVAAWPAAANNLADAASAFANAPGHAPEWPVDGPSMPSAHMPEPEPDNVPLPPTPHQPPSPDTPPEIIEPPDPGHDVPVREPGLYSMPAFPSSSSPIRYPQP